jgi:hypothetical protein
MVAIWLLRGLVLRRKLLTGNIGSLCEQQPLKALRAPCGPIPQYKMLYYSVVVRKAVPKIQRALR